ncbi:unnamed protein product [Schistosoma curassoni]|uniref:Uncharacterized protein n=1 Tax=Schistosoma curassoni TaxID=6186 RepID=A0A183KZ42_9TREM|nr:unnamed protein product [Schistosoma curassoni]
MQIKNLYRILYCLHLKSQQTKMMRNEKHQRM